jgi:hypothetical protein
MRIIPAGLVGVALSLAPMSASHAAPAKPLEDSCAMSLARADGSSGFQLERQCSKQPVTKGTASNVSLARAPVNGGSQIAGDGNGVVMSLLAISAIVGGIVVFGKSSNNTPNPAPIRPVSP